MSGYRCILLSVALILIFSPVVSSADVEPAEPDFGEVPVGTTASIDLTITNNDANTYFVNFLFGNGGCSFLIWAKGNLPLYPGVPVTVELRWTPTTEGFCSDSLIIEDVSGKVLEELTVIGSAVPEDQVKAPEPEAGQTTIIIGECDTGVEEGGLSYSITELAVSAKNHGDFVSGVAHLTKSYREDGVITKDEEQAIRRCAARAEIPVRMEEGETP